MSKWRPGPLGEIAPGTPAADEAVAVLEDLLESR